MIKIGARKNKRIKSGMPCQTEKIFEDRTL
jgi:hypothetical protein